MKTIASDQAAFLLEVLATPGMGVPPSKARLCADTLETLQEIVQENARALAEAAVAQRKES